MSGGPVDRCLRQVSKDSRQVGYEMRAANFTMIASRSREAMDNLASRCARLCHGTSMVLPSPAYTYWSAKTRRRAVNAGSPVQCPGAMRSTCQWS